MVKNKITPEMIEAAGKVIYGEEFTGDSSIVRNALEAAFILAENPKQQVVITYEPTPPRLVVVPDPRCGCGGYCGC